jgi:hypothetical protein
MCSALDSFGAQLAVGPINDGPFELSLARGIDVCLRSLGSTYVRAAGISMAAGQPCSPTLHPHPGRHCVVDRGVGTGGPRAASLSRDTASHQGGLLTCTSIYASLLAWIHRNGRRRRGRRRRRRRRRKPCRPLLFSDPAPKYSST